MLFVCLFMLFGVSEVTVSEDSGVSESLPLNRWTPASISLFVYTLMNISIEGYPIYIPGKVFHCPLAAGLPLEQLVHEVIGVAVVEGSGGNHRQESGRNGGGVVEKQGWTW